MAKMTHATVTLTTEHQNREKVEALMSTLFGRAGCLTCGRLVKFAVEFAGDPGPEMAKNGVIAISEG